MTVMTVSRIVTPLYDRVIVKRIVEEEMTKGGIVIPDSAKEKPVEGEIIEVGNGRLTDDGKMIPLAVKKGDHILFGKYSGQDIKIGLDDLLILQENEILAIVK